MNADQELQSPTSSPTLSTRRLYTIPKQRQPPSFISLYSLGVLWEGSICDKGAVKNIIIPHTQSIMTPTLYIDLPTKKLRFLKNIAKGTFGSIDLAERIDINGTIQVFVKKPIISGKSLLHEACVQKIVRDNLDNGGFYKSTPDIYDIFRMTDNSVCFTMEIIPNSQTLEDILLCTNDHNAVSAIIQLCIIQICSIMSYINTHIGLDHRDLKPSNILLNYCLSTIKTYHIRDIHITIDTPFYISLIDFGFACIGCPSTGETTLSLGTVYDIHDPCPKRGRDMYLFLSCLYSKFHNKMPDNLKSLFEKWLNIGDSNITQFLKRYIDCEQWIYFISGNPSIHKFNCTPHTVLGDIYTFISGN